MTVEEFAKLASAEIGLNEGAIEHVLSEPLDCYQVLCELAERGRIPDVNQAMFDLFGIDNL